MASLPADERTRLLERLAALLLDGRAASFLAPPASGPSECGLRRRSTARRLPDRLFDHQREVLAFLEDFAVPFDNNQVEDIVELEDVATQQAEEIQRLLARNRDFEAQLVQAKRDSHTNAKSSSSDGRRRKTCNL